ncbi:hypothetical protein [Streptomyces sp. NPDC090445]|uniref:hypothetical protein n=1 Tax=Streptomyces sp. NPDC090445 TaxID=3365963 RepID=UPI00380A2967
MVAYATTAGNAFPPAKDPPGGPVTVDPASSRCVVATADGELPPDDHHACVASAASNPLSLVER